MTAGLFGPLTRPELDHLITELEAEERLAHIALVNAPLRPEAVAGAAGVAQDIMSAYTDALDESVARMLAGETPLPHSVAGLCTLAPKRPRQDVGICRACVELGLFDELFGGPA